MRQNLALQRRLAVLSTLVIYVFFSLSAIASDDTGKVLNPQYAAWADFPSGSSVTVIMDTGTPDAPVHVEMTTMLRKVDESGVALNLRAVRTIAGRLDPVPDRELKYEHCTSIGCLPSLSSRLLTLMCGHRARSIGATSTRSQVGR